ncbi:MAG TPA: F0F1 ATP synthase subunit B [Patescibacteria group bacterium]
MEELVKNFGIQPVLLIAQIVNFLIVIWLLKKFAYKPIFDMLDKRKKVIEEGVKNAEESSKTLEKALEEEKKILKNAHTQAQDILTEAKDQAATSLAEAETSTKVRVEKMIEDGQKAIEKQAQEAESKLATQTAKIAVEILEKSLSGILDTKTQKEVVEKAAKKLTK